MNLQLSVIIPCYNNGNFLAKMLDCCIRQTYSSWEVIIVDDGSTDDTPQVCQSYVEKDNRIKFFRRDRQPKGSVVCRNIGFSHAQGKYVIHFDADDLISNTCFEKRVAFMENHPDVDYASFPAMSFSHDDDLPVYDESKPMYGVDKGYKDLLESFLSANYSFSTWNNIYKRVSIKNIIWDERVLIYTDFSYIIPCILFGLKHEFCNYHEIDYYYRRDYSGNVMTASFTSQAKHESTIYLFSKTLDSLKSREDYLVRRKQFLGLICVHFERLLHSGNKGFVDEYLCMMRTYYPSIVYKRYKIAASMSRLCGFKKYPVELFITLFCGSKKYINAFRDKLNVKKKN